MSKLGELKEILKKLIAIPSVTGNEHDIAIYIADYLRQCGVDSVELQPVEGKRLNVVAHLKGEKVGPVVLLTGHMDTVAPGEGWRTDPFKATERDGRIYGRGAADMKGGIAAILVAIRNAAAQREQMRGEAIIAFVCDEEAYSKGVDALIRSGIRADYGIAAEPEWDAVIGAVGKMLIKVRVYGIAAHGSQPEKGINAVEEGAKFLAALDRLPLGQHPKLGCPTICDAEDGRWIQGIRRSGAGVLRDIDQQAYGTVRDPGNSIAGYAGIGRTARFTGAL